MLACRWEFKAKHFDSLLCFKMVSHAYYVLRDFCLHGSMSRGALKQVLNLTANLTFRGVHLDLQQLLPLAGQVL